MEANVSTETLLVNSVLDCLYIIGDIELINAKVKHGPIFIDGGQAYAALKEEWEEVKEHLDATKVLADKFFEEHVRNESYIDTRELMADLRIHYIEMALESLQSYAVCSKIIETLNSYPEMDAYKVLLLPLLYPKEQDDE